MKIILICILVVISALEICADINQENRIRKMEKQLENLKEKNDRLEEYVRHY